MSELMLTEVECAERLGVSKGLLRKWRGANAGPAYCRLGRLIRYPADAVDAFIAETRIDPRSE